MDLSYVINPAALCCRALSRGCVDGQTDLNAIVIGEEILTPVIQSEFA